MTQKQMIDELNAKIAESNELIIDNNNSTEYAIEIASEREDNVRRERTIRILGKLSDADFNRILNYPLVFKMAAGFSTYVNRVLNGQLTDSAIHE